MVELEYKPDMTITESRQRLPLQFMDFLVPQKDLSRRRLVQGAQDMQKSALS